MSRRERLATYGYRGRQVSVFVEARRGHPRVCVFWIRAGQRHLETWPDTPQHRRLARQFAKGVLEGWDQATTRTTLTVRDLWDAYEAAEFPRLRPNSQRLYRDGWRRFELFVGQAFPAEDVTPKMLAELRQALEQVHLALNTIRQVIRIAKTVYAWGERLELVRRNRLHLFRFTVGKDERPVPPPEYTLDEVARLLAAFDPTRGDQWRPWVALAIASSQGTRQHAVVHLEDRDLDPTTGRITWRAAWDKTGKDWSQQAMPLTVEAFAVARAWKARLGVTSPWLLPSPKQGRVGACYTVQALAVAIRSAEDRAGIAHRKGRRGHGVRKNLSGDINAATGDALLAVHAIGDVDPRRAREYVQKRDERVDAALAARAGRLAELLPKCNPEWTGAGAVVERVAKQGVSSAPRRNRTYNLSAKRSDGVGVEPAVTGVKPTGSPFRGGSETPEHHPESATEVQPGTVARETPAPPSEGR
jgi:integrase